jgi:uncharacterized membrane protein YvbJ
MYCPKCEKEISEYDNYCPHCGVQTTVQLNQNTKNTNTITVGKVLAWPIGLFMLLVGVGSLSDGLHIFGSACILTGLIYLPIVNKYLQERQNVRLSTGFKIFVLIFTIVFVPVIQGYILSEDADVSSYTTSNTDSTEPLAIDMLTLVSDNGYVKDDGTHITLTIKNTGTRDVEYIQVQMSIYDNQQNLLSSKTLYPSPYDDWGLSVGESFDYEYVFYGENSASRNVKIVNARFS